VLFIGLFRYKTLGSGSDYTTFQHVFGIPSMDLRYTYDEVAFSTCHFLYSSLNKNSINTSLKTESYEAA